MSSNDDSAIFPPDHYEAIGRLIVACSRLDANLTELIGALCDLHILDALIVAHHQQFSSKHSTLLALLRGTDPDSEIDSDLLTTLNRAKEIYDLRSTIVHGLFAETENKKVLITRYQARGRLKLSKTPFDIETIRAIALEAEQLSAWLGRARDHFRSSHISS